MSAERLLYTELVNVPVGSIPVSLLTEVLFEIASGIGSFGYLNEWGDWFRYLLPRLIPRADETNVFPLLETVVSAFLAVYWTGHPNDYPEFRDDVLATLFQSLMAPTLWTHPSDRGEHTPPTRRFLDEKMTHSPSRFDGRLRGYSILHPLSALMVFGLRYLQPDEIPAWVESLTEISDPFFRDGLMFWLLGARPLLGAARFNPAWLDLAVPSLEWGHSHTLESLASQLGDAEPADLLPWDNCVVFLQEIDRLITPERYFRWLDELEETWLLLDNSGPFDWKRAAVVGPLDRILDRDDRGTAPMVPTVHHRDWLFTRVSREEPNGPPPPGVEERGTLEEPALLLEWEGEELEIATVSRFPTEDGRWVTVGSGRFRFDRYT